MCCKVCTLYKGHAKDNHFAWAHCRSSVHESLVNDTQFNCFTFSWWNLSGPSIHRFSFSDFASQTHIYTHKYTNETSPIEKWKPNANQTAKLIKFDCLHYVGNVYLWMTPPLFLYVYVSFLYYYVQCLSARRRDRERERNVFCFTVYYLCIHYTFYTLYIIHISVCIYIYLVVNAIWQSHKFVRSECRLYQILHENTKLTMVIYWMDWKEHAQNNIHICIHEHTHVMNDDLLFK